MKYTYIRAVCVCMYAYSKFKFESGSQALGHQGSFIFFKNTEHP